jgi:hypothetical protein
MRWLLIFGLLASLSSLLAPSIASSGQGCGCGSEERTCGCQPTYHCCHHCRHRHHRERIEVTRGESQLATIPTGPIVESMPVYRTTPALVFAPVVTEAAYVRTREIEPRRESVCEGSSDRIGQLETSVKTLNERMILIEDSIRAQNELLLKLKNKLLAE